MPYEEGQNWARPQPVDQEAQTAAIVAAIGQSVNRPPAVLVQPLWTNQRFDDGTAGINLNGANVNSGWIDISKWYDVQIFWNAVKTSTPGNLTWLVQVGYGESYPGSQPLNAATYDLLKVTGTAVEGAASVTTSATNTQFVSLPNLAAKWIRVNLAGAITFTGAAYYTITAQVIAKTPVFYQ